MEMTIGERGGRERERERGGGEREGGERGRERGGREGERGGEREREGIHVHMITAWSTIQAMIHASNHSGSVTVITIVDTNYKSNEYH